MRTRIVERKLTRSIEISGFTFTGRPARVIFHPTRESGFVWRTSDGNLQIDHSLATVKRRRIELNAPNGDVMSIDFPGLGRKQRVYEFPKHKFVDREVDSPSQHILFERIMNAPPLGWPPNIQPIAWFWHKLFNWPHYSKFVWPHQFKNGNREELLEAICDHRAVDLLGALGLVHKKGLPSGKLVSYRAGHDIDKNTIQKIHWNG